MPHGSANWLRRSDTGISFCRGEEGGVGWGERVEGGGGKAEREMKIVGACACMWGVMVGEWFAWGGAKQSQ